MSLKSIQTILLLFLSVTCVNILKADSWDSYDSIINSIKTEAWNLRYSDKTEADKKLAEGLKLAMEPLRSRSGVPAAYNAGLLGYLEAAA